MSDQATPASAPGQPESTTPHGSEQTAKLWWLLAAVSVLLLFVALEQVDASLGRIEVAGYQAHTLTGVGQAFRFHESEADVQEAWCVWHSFARDQVQAGAVEGCPTAVKGDLPAQQLIRGFLILDAVMVLLYVPLAWWLVRRLRRGLRPCSGLPLEQGLHAATRWPLWFLLGGVLISEAAEAVAQLRLAARGGPVSLDLAARILALAIPAKWILAATLAVLLLLLVVHRSIDVREHQLSLTQGASERLRAWSRVLVMLRVQLLLVGALALVLARVGLEQVPDALLRWADGPWNGLAGLVAVVGLGLLVWRSIHRTALTADRELKPFRPVLVVLAAGVLVAQNWLWPRWPNLAGLGVVLAVVAVLSWLVGAAPWHIEERHEHGAAGLNKAMEAAKNRALAPGPEISERIQSLARWLAAVPLAALGFGLVRAAAAPALLQAPERERPVLLAGLGAVLALSAAAIPGLLARWEGHIQLVPHYMGSHLLYWTLSGLALLVWWLVISKPQEVPVRLGAVAILASFLAVTLTLLNELQRWSERAVPVAGLRGLGFLRTPVLLLLIAWFFVGAMFDHGGFHDARIETGVNRPSPSIAIRDAFRAWVAANCAGAGATTRSEVPMVFVAGAGGGIRAAYWTAGVLDALFPKPAVRPAGGCSEKPSSNRVFAASGISGSSLGIVAWLSQLEGGTHDPPPYQHPVGQQTWYDKTFGVDHLSATLAWMLYVELPRSLLGFNAPDRAEVLERSWEASQPQLEKHFLESYSQRLAPAGQARAKQASTNQEPAWLPLALLNGTSVESGCRVLTSPLDLSDYDATPGGFSCRARPERDPVMANRPVRMSAPALSDLVGTYACQDQDLRRSTAALLSARFPYVSPSGRLTRCANKDEHAYVVDGGYVESSASLSAHDLYQQVEQLVTCHNLQVGGRSTKHPTGCDKTTKGRPIRPILVQVDNGYVTVATPPAGPRPKELVVPPMGSRATSAAVEPAVRQRAHGTFANAPGLNYVVIANVRHPGIQAPLGWMLSRAALQDLRKQLVTATGAASPLIFQTPGKGGAP